MGIIGQMGIHNYSAHDAHNTHQAYHDHQTH